MTLLETILELTQEGSGEITFRPDFKDNFTITVILYENRATKSFYCKTKNEEEIVFMVNQAIEQIKKL